MLTRNKSQQTSSHRGINNKSQLLRSLLISPLDFAAVVDLMLRNLRHCIRSFAFQMQDILSRYF